jgi:hypothetical protein
VHEDVVVAAGSGVGQGRDLGVGGRRVLRERSLPRLVEDAPVAAVVGNDMERRHSSSSRVGVGGATFRIAPRPRRVEGSFTSARFLRTVREFAVAAGAFGTITPR